MRRPSQVNGVIGAAELRLDAKDIARIENA
jgi:hypothetical protein